jgi:hypothetical protein
MDGSSTLSYIYPTHTFAATLDISLGKVIYNKLASHYNKH